MTSQEARNELIVRLMSKLLKTMIVKKDDRYLYKLETQALNILRKHHSISTNRHEVRRKIDDLKEKFTVDNLQEYGEHLEQLCFEVLSHPLCLKHYQVDVHWSLLDFLIEIAYNPTGALRRNQHKIILPSSDTSLEDDSQEFEEMEIKNLLKEDFIPLTKYDDGDSDLSDWSDDEKAEEGQNNTNIKENNQELLNLRPIYLLPNLPPLSPPTKIPHFQIKTPEHNLRERMKESLQNSWWLTDTADLCNDEDLSQNVASNFASMLSNFIPNDLENFDYLRKPIIITEFCLLREILWMFYAPQNCKAFEITTGKIRYRIGVTIPSVSAPTLASYVENQILPHMNQMFTIRTFLNSINNLQNCQLPKTYDFYAGNLRSLLEPITEKIVDFESRVAHQHDFELNTLIEMQTYLKESFQMLSTLHAIHKFVTLDYRKLPAHIISSYLLAALIQFCNMSSKPIESNLSISLFLLSIKAFCGIIDCWWNEGRLDDWQEEFVVECNAERNVSLRLMSKDKEKTFHVQKDISDVICENDFIRLLLAHSMEVGHTLNLLYEISRIGDLKNNCKAIEGSLYEVFIEDVLHHIRNLDVTTENSKNSHKEKETDDVDAKSQTSTSTDNLNSTNFITNDEFLLLLFGSNNEKDLNPSISKDAVDAKASHERNALDLYEELSKYQEILPYEKIILSSFGRILRERIALANMFVVKLFLEEFQILTHLRNIRKVLLLEADALMLQFYGKLFNQIEEGKNWANSFVLTMRLDDILSSKYPEISSHFRFEIDSKKGTKATKVVEAVKSFSINYNLSNELSKIIDEEDMKIYNRIFQFLLQIKWGLMTLENLPFVRINQPLYIDPDIIKFNMRRLEHIRFWMISALQCIASHLLMLQAIGEDLDEQLEQCTTVREMRIVHKSYLETISEHCFLTKSLKGILIGIEQLLNLVLVLQSDHQSCTKQLIQNNPLSLEDSGGSDELENDNYWLSKGIDQIELTYIRCHEYLANALKNEVYIKQRNFLSGLSAAFNTSMPC